MTSADLIRAAIEANLAAGAAVALVALARRPARRRLGPRAAYALWLAVPIAALAVLAPSPWRQVITLQPQPQVAPVTFDMAQAITAPPPPLDPNALLLAAWLLGALACAAALAFSQVGYLRALGRLSRDGDVTRAEARAVGPAVIGALTPRIVVPADFETRFAPEEREVILAHERAHIRSGDAQINALAAAIRCLAWFNPLIHLGAWLMRIDQELACDAAVLSLHPGRRRLYAEALLKTQLAQRPLPFGCTWPSGAADPLKERIAMLKLSPPTRARRAAGAILTVGACLTAGLAAWAAQPARQVIAPGAATVAPTAPSQAGSAEVDAQSALDVSSPVSLTNSTLERPEPAAAPVARTPVIGRDHPWVRTPTAAEFAGIMPKLEPGQQARAAISCTLGADGSLNGCAIPTTMNLAPDVAAAALAVSSFYQMAPTMADGASVEGARVQVPILFSMPAGPVSTSADQFRMREGVSTLTGNVTLHSPAGDERGGLLMGGQPGSALVLIGEGQSGPTTTLQPTREASALSTAADVTPPVRVNDRFFRGGAPFRGFDTANTGPRLTPTSAQPTPPARPSVITNPTWLARPTAADLSGVYPARAMRLEREGRAILRCTVTDAGTLGDCLVMAESPADVGFGEAALSMAGKYRMAPTTRDGVPVGGARVNVPIDFKLGSGNP